MAPDFHTCRHTVLFYRDAGAVRASVTGYVEAALRAGHPALVIARPELAHDLTIELHRCHVHGRPFGPDRGELLVLDAEATLDSLCLAGRPDEARFREVVGAALASLATGHKRVAAYGEMVGVLCERGRYADAVHLESLWNALLAESDASLFCGYPRHLFQPPEARGFYEQIRAAHAETLDDEDGAGPTGTYPSRAGARACASSARE
ncbi:MEDS domain-containing protein [Ramlibacter alkalitolerans]|uniref:MEDS domain-containing protein n=1 Tax=Ramlibacter alkalitolerans TaxID=2039631 RepID=A0ABS1JN13_9BURK|nr:MEDS domain-containing protein [Ramlibacter alkalitolerans]MBL0425632.1 MEDS domain-containing protein [Ramlibacter alkalitolerans]